MDASVAVEHALEEECDRSDESGLECHVPQDAEVFSVAKNDKFFKLNERGLTCTT